MTCATSLFPGRGTEEAHDLRGGGLATHVRPADRGQRAPHVGPAHHRGVQQREKRLDVAAGPPTHAAVNSALTSGFSSAFEVAGFVAIAGFVTAIAAVRHRPEEVAAEEMDQAA
jgi:hypothetical protein